MFWTDWAPLDKSGDVGLATEFDYYLEADERDQNYLESCPSCRRRKASARLEYVSIVQVGTKNKELAEEFLNQMIAPKAQQAFAVETYSGVRSAHKGLGLTAAEQARCILRLGCVEKLRFFDPQVFADNRAVWTERLNTEVVPKWGTR